MSTIHLYPETPPSGLAGLWTELRAAVPADASLAASFPTELAELHASPTDVAVIVVDTWVHEVGTEVVSEVARLVDGCRIPVVFVVGDGYIGSDEPSLTSIVGASVVSAARSMAARRKGNVRANVVAVPAAAFGYDGVQRGPLKQSVEVADVANAIAFLIGDEGGYVSGQVLFVDGGRHLFSSQTA